MKKPNTASAYLSIAVLFIGGLQVPFCISTLQADEAKPKISNPSKFKVRYDLTQPARSGSGAPSFFAGNSAVASVAVNILDERFYPVKTFVLRDVKVQERIESLWDGRDAYGKEMPAGSYYASLSIIYSDGTKSSRMFKFVKD